jgi:DNA sulfur modification protein DndB
MNSETKRRPLILPALRGLMGDWVYYSCLMKIKELSERVEYANQIHNSKRLSEMIQRQLKGDRSSQIAEYLESQKERFFNSLVIATYRGQPNWHALSSVRPKSKHSELDDLDEATIESVGFLTLRGDETLFALDGQHRLAGIKKAIEAGLKHDTVDEVSVIVVAHAATKKGLERTRRLFTTLNKTARPVSKGDIIALDEDDVMAICVRRLIEETDLFPEDRIAFVASNNMPVANTTSLTTIGNLYDVLTILFTSTRSDLRQPKADLSRARPSDGDLIQYFKYAQRYLLLLRDNFAELEAFFSSKDSGSVVKVVKRYRGSHGGKVLFRPIGLEVITRIIARLTNSMDLEDAVELAARLPRDLAAPPYVGLIWDAARSTITNAHKATLREVLLNMLGDYAKWEADDLVARYRKDTGDDAIALPRRLV